jgi:hypothetical protein
MLRVPLVREAHDGPGADKGGIISIEKSTAGYRSSFATRIDPPPYPRIDKIFVQIISRA